MVLALSIGIATAVGTLLGNLGVFWVIGRMAQRQEKKQREELQRLQNEFLEMRQKEAERMKRYASMEG
jgi:membrane protein YqaA with SNARE-associated domain